MVKSCLITFLSFVLFENAFLTMWGWVEPRRFFNPNSLTNRTTGSSPDLWEVSYSFPKALNVPRYILKERVCSEHRLDSDREVWRWTGRDGLYFQRKWSMALFSP